MKIKNLFITLLTVGFLTVALSSCKNSSEEQSAKNTQKQKNEEISKASVISTTATSSSTDEKIGPKNPKKVHQLTTEEFKKWVFDYENNQKWAYAGDKPCVIDFYADWCRPCKMVAPIMEELAKEYNGEVYFYKVDVDKETELAQAFGIRSIPSVLFCPKNGQPQMAVGAMAKENYVAAIKDVMGVSLPQ